MWNFGGIALFLDVAASLAVEEICCHPRVISTDLASQNSLHGDNGAPGSIRMYDHHALTAIQDLTIFSASWLSRAQTSFLALILTVIGVCENSLKVADWLRELDTRAVDTMAVYTRAVDARAVDTRAAISQKVDTMAAVSYPIINAYLYVHILIQCNVKR